MNNITTELPEISTVDDESLDRDSWQMNEAVNELVRVYQFRDRKCIMYYDVSCTQCYAIAALIEHGTMTLRRLADELFLDKSTASRVIDSLQRKGYVLRTADPSDSRALRLRVTEKGVELNGKIQQDLVNELRELLVDFDPEVRRATTSLISRLARAANDRFTSQRCCS